MKKNKKRKVVIIKRTQRINNQMQFVQKRKQLLIKAKKIIKQELKVRHRGRRSHKKERKQQRK